MMTRKHFEALAKALRLNRPGTNPDSQQQVSLYDQWQKDVVAVAAICEFSNVSFNLKRFLLAAGFEYSEAERYCL